MSTEYLKKELEKLQKRVAILEKDMDIKELHSEEKIEEKKILNMKNGKT